MSEPILRQPFLAESLDERYLLEDDLLKVVLEKYGATLPSVDGYDTSLRKESLSAAEEEDLRARAIEWSAEDENDAASFAYLIVGKDGSLWVNDQPWGPSIYGSDTSIPVGSIESVGQLEWAVVTARTTTENTALGSRIVRIQPASFSASKLGDDVVYSCGPTIQITRDLAPGEKQNYAWPALRDNAETVDELYAAPFVRIKFTQEAIDETDPLQLAELDLRKKVAGGQEQAHINSTVAKKINSLLTKNPNIDVTPLLKYAAGKTYFKLAAETITRNPSEEEQQHLAEDLLSEAEATPEIDKKTEHFVAAVQGFAKGNCFELAELAALKIENTVARAKIMAEVSAQTTNKEQSLRLAEQAVTDVLQHGNITQITKVRDTLGDRIPARLKKQLPGVLQQPPATSQQKRSTSSKVQVTLEIPLERVKRFSAQKIARLGNLLLDEYDKDPDHEKLVKALAMSEFITDQALRTDLQIRIADALTDQSLPDRN